MTLGLGENETIKSTLSVARAFDTVAERFEAEFENDITCRIRSKVYEVIDQYVPPNSSILDVNCGVGIDPVKLARDGHRVTGLDISPNMIAQALKRAYETKGVRINFQVGSFEDLSQFSNSSFDLVLSNFGGLNCIQRLDRSSSEVGRVVAPGGHCIAMVMPPVCLWEAVAGLCKFNLGFAFRRLKGQSLATGFHGRTFDVYYHAPRPVRRMFSAQFEVCALLGINIFSPPPHALSFAQNHVKLTSLLRWIDDRLERFPVLRAMGDHYIIMMKKK